MLSLYRCVTDTILRPPSGLLTPLILRNAPPQSKMQVGRHFGRFHKTSCLSASDLQVGTKRLQIERPVQNQAKLRSGLPLAKVLSQSVFIPLQQENLTKLSGEE